MARSPVLVRVTNSSGSYGVASYTVPPGKVFVGSMQMAVRFASSGSTLPSYVALDGELAITLSIAAQDAQRLGHSPLVLPPGTVVSADEGSGDGAPFTLSGFLYDNDEAGRVPVSAIATSASPYAVPVGKVAVLTVRITSSGGQVTIDGDPAMYLPGNTPGKPVILPAGSVIYGSQQAYLTGFLYDAG